MMIAIIAKFRARPGAAADLAAVFREMTANVRAKEPGNKLYQIVRSRTDPDLLIAMELFESDSAFKAHMAAPYFVEMRPRLEPLLAGPPEMEFLDTLD